MFIEQVPDPPKAKKEDVLWNQAPPASVRLQLDSGEKIFLRSVDGQTTLISCVCDGESDFYLLETTVAAVIFEDIVAIV